MDNEGGKTTNNLVLILSTTQPIASNCIIIAEGNLILYAYTILI